MVCFKLKSFLKVFFRTVYSGVIRLVHYSGILSREPSQHKSGNQTSSSESEEVDNKIRFPHTRHPYHLDCWQSGHYSCFTDIWIPFFFADVELQTERWKRWRFYNRRRGRSGRSGFRQSPNGKSSSRGRSETEKGEAPSSEKGESSSENPPISSAASRLSESESAGDERASLLEGNEAISVGRQRYLEKYSF